MRFITPTLALLWLLWSGSPVEAQALRRQPTPFSVWLDFDALSKANAPSAALPIWLESVQAQRSPAPASGEETTTFRLRFRHFGDLSREVELRVFFEDLPGVNPILSGWTETGGRRWNSGPLGDGLGLPTSETLIVPAGQIDYLDLSVPGHGDTIRGLFLSSTRTTKTRFALDFSAPANFADPFGHPAPAPKAAGDTFLLGRVKAVLEAGPLRISTDTPASWNFELDRVPDLAVLNFEVLNPVLSTPPAASLNGRVLGPVSLILPDLADPAYRGHSVPREADTRFNYTGWLRGQLILPASSLQVGVNELDLVAGSETSAVALRAVELQLKYPVDEPSTP